ncbi:unnamed protein product [Choristocarpus tenellus]
MLLLIFLLASGTVLAGPLAAIAAYGSCQTGCNGVAVACYTAGGAVFGATTAGVALSPALLACNAALGTCMGTCAVVAGLAAVTPTF